jgi:hypothetical protein
MNDKQAAMIDYYGATSNAVLRVTQGVFFRIAYPDNTKHVKTMHDDNTLPELFLERKDAEDVLNARNINQATVMKVQWHGAEVIDQDCIN